MPERNASWGKRIGSLFRTTIRWALRPKTVFLDAQFTRVVVARYCHGKGCELGPGVNPQTDPNRTIYIDKFRWYQDRSIYMDVVGDASALPITSSTFDYLVSSHVLEHCPNTILSVLEWLRVLKPGGILVLRLPHKERTFDRFREITFLSHHIEDFERNVGYDDKTHVTEFIENAVSRFEFHWLPAATNVDGAIDPEYLLRHGHIHYHVWTQNEIIDLLRYLKADVLFVMDLLLDREDSFLVVCRKPREE